MPITQIKELRILPPFAIARFGSSPIPLENYECQIVDPFDFRQIVPAPTLIVDDATGAITEETLPVPNSLVRFRDSEGRVKPLAPFLEVWARFEDGGMLQPLTKEHLKELRLEPSALRWSIQAANIKVFRRTGDVKDKVVANVQIEADPVDPNVLHRAFPLLGRSKNFKMTDKPPGPKTISLGTVRYVRPTDKFPEIRFRFTPASGKVYGTRAGDPLIADDVYAGVTALPAPPHGPWSVPFAGTWDRYWEGAPGSPPLTAPGDIFQGQTVGATKVSDGYFDDTCDGIVEVSLRVGSETLTAYARFMSCVPDFAPDSYHVRTIADDLEQMAYGPDVAVPTTPAEEKQLKEDVIDTIRRAYETIRLMNTSVQNGDQNVGGVKENNNNMPGQENGDFGRVFEPVFETASQQASYKNALAQHKRILQTALNASSLAGAFGGISFVRTYANVSDLRRRERQRMPPLMRGSEGVELALTRRQYAKLALAAPPRPPTPAGVVELAARPIVSPPAPVALQRIGRPAPRVKSVRP